MLAKGTLVLSEVCGIPVVLSLEQLAQRDEQAREANTRVRVDEPPLALRPVRVTQTDSACLKDSCKSSELSNPPGLSAGAREKHSKLHKRGKLGQKRGLIATARRNRNQGPHKEKFEIFNLDMKTGNILKVKGKISDDADRSSKTLSLPVRLTFLLFTHSFSINLGCSSSDLAFHFNPRFNESVIVCNSKCSKAWQTEHRDNHFCFSRGSTVKIIIEMLADKFLVKLPDRHEVEFPNRHSYNKISYMSVKGGFRVTSFKLE
ncbi:hypothetical protein QYF61_018349 [Mycteria americana]|uniref:Galectin n=1 Tax=Mycteria americana TaxID=33587 RepID=A0AAN7S4D8_MYCAM|nr:hypothetical protein QYF61_018349 [Mycteria americana]